VRIRDRGPNVAGLPLAAVLVRSLDGGFDSFWEADQEVPEFDPERILAIADELHRPARALFDSVVTEKLREEVFRRHREEVESS
jgi:hypothetical protein